MDEEFDAVEGGLVKTGVNRRNSVLLVLAVAFAVSGSLAIFASSEVDRIEVSVALFGAGPILVWLSVVLVRQTSKELYRWALLFAVLMSVLWLSIFLSILTPGV